MSKHAEKSLADGDSNDATESIRQLAREDIASQIAVLVVRLYHHRKADGSKKCNENALK